MVVVQFQYLKKTILCFVGTGVSNFYNMTFCMECQKFASIWMIKTIFPFSNIKISLHAHSCCWNNFQLMHCHHAPEHHHHQRKCHHYYRNVKIILIIAVLSKVLTTWVVFCRMLLAPAFGPTFQYWDDLSLLTFDSNLFHYFLTKFAFRHKTVWLFPLYPFIC